MFKFIIAIVLFVALPVQAATYVFCTDESEAVITVQDGDVFSDDLPTCSMVSPVRQIEAIVALDLDSGERVWKVKLLDTDQVGYLVRKGA